MSGLLSLGQSSSESCALLFFGIGRKFKEKVYPSIMWNLLRPNPECDVFVHTYNVTKVMGKRGGEDGTGSVNASDISLLQKNRSAIMFESDKSFRHKRNVNYYRTLFPRPSRWDYPSSIDNMVRQWHSIEMVWAIMETHEMSVQARYTDVGLFRLDVVFTHPIIIDGADEVAVIPPLMYEATRSKTAWGGYNDRLFYGKREYAKPWATERFNSVPSYLHWQKTNKHYDQRRGLHSEDFLRWLLVFHFPTPLKTKPLCFHRIRSTGMVMNDCHLIAARFKFNEAKYGNKHTEARGVALIASSVQHPTKISDLVDFPPRRRYRQDGKEASGVRHRRDGKEASGMRGKVRQESAQV
ncbi:hypothetical protein ACHAXT_003804 [Thalassiosira profunda]